METQSTDGPCRLFVLLARNADVGVILRTGPTSRTQVIRWDTAQDTFTPGQWFYGRIYNRQTDLSPDGDLMVYCAEKTRHVVRDNYDEYEIERWTAVSRPPYLTALALWPARSWTTGGGLFETEKSLWLSHPDGSMNPRPDLLPLGLESITSLDEAGTRESVLFQRLERDGWLRREPEMREPKPSKGRSRRSRYGASRSFQERAQYECAQSPSWKLLRSVSRRHYEKLGPDGVSTLLMSFFGGGGTFKFAIRREGTPVLWRGVEWADWDRRGRLVFARDGKLYAGSIDQDRRLWETELADFNAAKRSRCVLPSGQHAGNINPKD